MLPTPRDSLSTGVYVSEYVRALADPPIASTAAKTRYDAVLDVDFIPNEGSIIRATTGNPRHRRPLPSRCRVRFTAARRSYRSPEHMAARGASLRDQRRQRIAHALHAGGDRRLREGAREADRLAEVEAVTHRQRDD